MEIWKTTKILPCDLTHQEWEDKSEQLAQTVIEQDDLEFELLDLQEDVKTKKAEIKAKGVVISRLGKAVNERKEDREVKCVWNMNQPVRGMKQLIRMDIKEIIDEKDMTDYDKKDVADSLQIKMEIA